MGDFALIEAIKVLPKAEGNIFWLLWIGGLIITSVVFLNFIVAEASASYETVITKLDKINWQQKAHLILECEDMTSKKSFNDHKLPKYVISRKIV